ncbi:LysM peptidoglycan-binding domain-containing protein [Agromyces salentinus]|uniref:LysM domain-containing protein n=1 Tax=Agromyces salentinus TaxID=269421 RepID=A0ABP4ZAQ8_9MICO|nr:LysM peptidoglycan-binding domain-containing protein [Agromyces salentinus]
MSAVMVTGSYAGNSATSGFDPHAFDGVRSRLRLTRRGRVVLTILSAIPVAVFAAVLVLGSGGAAAEVDAPSNVGLSYLTVADGESLWGIAESIAPGSDPREIISEIMRLNGLDDSTVQPGQRLALPAVR